MPVKLKVYTNDDDALLYWSIEKSIDGCRGFAINRQKTNAAGVKNEDYLPNRVGFENESLPQPKGGESLTQSSTKWPFQRFSWTDHDANNGDTVSYQIIPVTRAATGELNLFNAEASDWSPPKTLGETAASKFKAFFNRGFIMSQFMARYLIEKNQTLAQFKNTIKNKDDKNIRLFLSGGLRLALLDQLQTALAEKTDIYAALFELSDEELIDALCALGKKAHLVLANGSVTKKKEETAEQARQRDENKIARARLIKAKVDVQTDNRFISPGALGHNKFLIRTDKNGEPLIAWTGSTNWAPTGLCTQVNNGLLIQDPDIARVYMEQWQRLRDAASDFPKTLVAENSKPKNTGQDIPGNAHSVVWFTRASKSVDIQALTDAVSSAKQGVLFLMFMPGEKGVLETVTQLTNKPGIYVRGVVSTLPKGYGDESQVSVSFVNGREVTPPVKLDIIQPQNVKNTMAYFVAEVKRNDFLAKIGYAIIHSKVLLIDPFSDDPTVITGSHNFSGSASTKNDENFIIVKGDRDLAEAYAVNIMGAYAHYRWRAYLGLSNKPYNGLKDNDKWQANMLQHDQSEMHFWGV
jgi:phosphatidylserine/phosphatidylglycerophosphate/cardiolipin synthase-like enzyme